MNFACRYCRSRLGAYIHGELDLKARRRIARHLDECPACRADCIAEREIADELSRRMAFVGQLRTPQLRRMWAEIQSETWTEQAIAPRRHPKRYGLAALALLMVMVFPWTLGNQNLPFSIPTQPAPSSSATASPRGSTSRGAANTPVTVALRGGEAGEATAGTPGLVLWNTPDPTSVQ